LIGDSKPVTQAISKLDGLSSALQLRLPDAAREFSTNLELAAMTSRFFFCLQPEPEKFIVLLEATVVTECKEDVASHGETFFKH
jgi:hypothetical protein